MEQKGNLYVQLVGGPMDGDQIILAANGSVGVPQQLCYITATGDQAAWLVYETDQVFDGLWPDDHEKRSYHFIGTYTLGKDKKIS